MTQGYGPQNGQDGQSGSDGQQGQWGQDAPQWEQPAPAQPQSGAQPGAQASPAQPQWSAQPGAQASPAQSQWGQVPPPAAPGGYPGANGYAGTAATSADAGKGALAKKLGIALLILSVVAVIARLATPIFKIGRAHV